MIAQEDIIIVNITEMDSRLAVSFYIKCQTGACIEASKIAVAAQASNRMYYRFYAQEQAYLS